MKISLVAVLFALYTAGKAISWYLRLHMQAANQSEATNILEAAWEHS